MDSPKLKKTTLPSKDLDTFADDMKEALRSWAFPEERSSKRLHAVGLQVKSAAVYVSNKIPPPFPFVPFTGLLSKRALT